MPQKLLESANILDLSLDTAGAYCTRLLADLGAAVLMVEPPGGHPLRAAGPFAAGEADPEKSGSFIHFSSNKRSVVADVESKEGRERVLELAQDADIVVESFAPGRIAELGLGYDTLSALRETLVLTSLTPFGQTGRWSQWQSEEIVDWALGGYMYFGGDPAREPLMVHNKQGAMHGGAHAAYASLAALWWARKSGRGQHVDVSVLESLLTAHIWTTTSWTQEGLVMRREGSDLLRCKDGWVHFLSLAMNPNLFILIQRPDLIDDPRFQDQQTWMEHQAEVRELVQQWCGSQPKVEIWKLGQELRIPCAPVFDMADLAEAQNLKDRGFLVEVDHPNAGKVLMPGAPYVFDGSPFPAGRPAPSLGQHQQGWPETAARPPDAPAVSLGRPLMASGPGRAKPLPLEGIRVLEMTNNWAGPVAGRNLGDLGAEVIRIESPGRIGPRASKPTAGQNFRYHYNRSSYNVKLNRNKYGITLDVGQPEGRALFLRLVKESDVLIENNSPRVMRNLGIEYEVLREANPGFIMVQIAAYGQTGPFRDFIAFGANIEAACGLASVTGYRDDERPYRTGYYYADPVTATHASLAVLAALHRREQTGQGSHVDLALQENGIAFFPEAFLQYSMSGQMPQRRGNRHAVHAPQGCYPSMGDDMWMVLCVRDDDEWGRLMDILEDDRLSDPKFRTRDGRRACHDELDGIISEWSRGYDHNEAANLLQARGIPAAPVLANWEMVSNIHIHERGFYVPVPHREIGVFPYPGIVWKLPDTPGDVRMAAADYGEHNALVFKEFLGIGDGELSRLYDKRVIADDPLPQFRLW